MKTLTFAQTFHPEDDIIGEDGDGIGVTLSPWETFFYEARGDIPIVAVAERIDEADEVRPSTVVQVVVEDSTASRMEKGEPGNNVSTSNSAASELPSRPVGKGCFYLEGFIGGLLAFIVVMTVFMIELTAVIVYLLAVGFHNIANACCDGGMTIFFRALFLLIVHILLMIDSIFLFCSVIISEFLGFTTGVTMLILCALTGNCHNVAYQWQQYIRKLGHLSRWAFRSFHLDWKLKRIFPINFDAAYKTNPPEDEVKHKDDEPTIVVDVSADNIGPKTGKTSSEAFQAPLENVLIYKSIASAPEPPALDDHEP